MAHVGSPTDNTTSSNAGAIFVFEKTASGWIDKTKLLASDGQDGDRFGYSLAYSDNYLIVGAKDVDALGSNSGAAYLYQYDGSNWSEKTKIYDISKGKDYESFGRSVGIDSYHFIVGAYGSNSATVFPIDYTLSSLYVWTGSAGNGDWNDPANWNPAGLPGANDDVSIPAGSDTVFCSSGDIVVRNLEIQYGYPDKSYLFLTGGSMTVMQDLTVYGVFDMFTDPATNIPPGLIVNGNFIGGGPFTFNYYIPENDPDWHAISSPVPFNTISGFINDFYMNIWDETQNSFLHIEPVDCNLPNFNFASGQGAFIKLEPDYATTSNCAAQNPPTIDYSTGQPQFIEITAQNNTVHNSDFAYPLTYTAGGSYSGWNLLGNPYTATIDITALTWDAGVDQSIQIWDGSNYISGTASGVGNYLIPASQGFFVHTNNTANFNFAKNALTTQTVPVYKSDNAVLKLRASSEMYDDVTYICIDGEASSNFDTRCDAPKKFTPVEQVPQIYTVAASGQKLSINSVNTLNESMPLYFRSGTSGEFTLEVVETSGFETVILEDLLTGEKTDLLKNVYSFNYSTLQTDNRFVLHFAPLSVAGVQSSEINIFAGEGIVTVNINEPGVSHISVYDVAGRKITEMEAAQGRNVLRLNRGFYIVSVEVDNSLVTGKVIVK
jgi:hypothetical protein